MSRIFAVLSIFLSQIKKRVQRRYVLLRLGDAPLGSPSRKKGDLPAGRGPAVDSLQLQPLQEPPEHSS